MTDERTAEEKHVWQRTRREVRAKDGKPKSRAVKYCSRCGLTVGAELGDVLRPTCAERIVRDVMDS